MKTNPLRHIALLLILALQLTSALAQQVTNMGTDFWMVVLPNDSGGSDCNLYIYSEQAGTVSIRDFYGLVAQQNVGTMGFVHAVSTNPNNSFGFIDLHSIHITSTTPVAVFAYNIDPQPSSLDASLIMPTSALGTDYMIQTYPSVIEGHGCASNFSMVAVENNTTVDVTLTADDIAGHSAGNTVHQVLSQGK